MWEKLPFVRSIFTAIHACLFDVHAYHIAERRKNIFPNYNNPQRNTYRPGYVLPRLRDSTKQWSMVRASSERVVPQNITQRIFAARQFDAAAKIPKLVIFIGDDDHLVRASVARTESAFNKSRSHY